MTSPFRPGALRVDADLRLDIDGVQAQVVGHGDELRVVTDRPSELWRAARRSAPDGGRIGTALVRRAVGALAENGITLVIPAPSGTSVRVGASARPSIVGRLAGSPHIQVDLGPRARRLRAVFAAVAVTALGLAALRRARR